MSAVYDATMAGNRAPARPARGDRGLLAAVDGQGNRPRQPGRAGGGDRVRWSAARRSSGLMAVLDEISRGLESLVAEGDNILVVADAQGRVLWRSGSTRCSPMPTGSGSSRAHTGARGASAPTRSVPRWCPSGPCRCSPPSTSCAATTRGPARVRRSGTRRTGQVIGVVDVSGPAATVHPTTVALVDAVARLAESHLREQHDRTLNRLRTVAAPILARIGQPALAVDADGWVAAVDRCHCTTGSCCPTNIADIAPGRVRLSTARHVRRRAAARRLVGAARPPTTRAGQLARVTLDLRNPEARRRWRWRSVRRLAPRYLAAPRRDPARAGNVARGSVRDRTCRRPVRRSSRVVTVRAEMSRLRKQFAGLLAAQPYRFASTVDLDVLYPGDMSMLLPSSTAPFVRAARSRRGDGI